MMHRQIPADAPSLVLRAPRTPAEHAAADILLTVLDGVARRVRPVPISNIAAIEIVADDNDAFARDYHDNAAPEPGIEYDEDINP